MESGNSSRPKRGFALLDAARQKEVSAMGGRAAQASGNARTFDSDSARYASSLSRPESKSQSRPETLRESSPPRGMLDSVLGSESDRNPSRETQPENKSASSRGRALRPAPQRAQSSDDLEAVMTLRRAQLKLEERAKRNVDAANGKRLPGQRMVAPDAQSRPKDTELTKQLVKNLASRSHRNDSEDRA